MRLLIAEDEIPLSNALVTVFRHNNYSVDAVFNGKAALEYLSSDIYDAVILDIMMPEMNGLEVLRRTREAGNRVPVILLTAKSEIEDRVEGLDLGADDYLTKPFSVKELLARVRALIRRNSEVSVGNVKRIGDLSLDVKSFELMCGERSVKLNNKEFQMMDMLISAGSNVISAERFMEKVWGYDSDTEINVVWVYISNLRKKLASLGSKVKVHASRNLGYRLEAEE